MANKPLKFVEHAIEDNIVLTNKKPNQYNKETFLIGASKVSVGITNTAKQVIKVDPVTGLNYSTNATEMQQVYNFQTQKHGCYFALALECGRGGKSWYPGSKYVANTNQANVEVKADMDDTSETLATITSSGTTVKILDEDSDSSGISWNQIEYKNGESTIEGYVKKITYLINFRYVDREE